MGKGGREGRRGYGRASGAACRDSLALAVSDGIRRFLGGSPARPPRRHAGRGHPPGPPGGGRDGRLAPGGGGAPTRHRRSPSAREAVGETRRGEDRMRGRGARGGEVATSTWNNSVFSICAFMYGVMAFQLWLFCPSTYNTLIFSANVGFAKAVKSRAELIHFPDNIARGIMGERWRRRGGFASQKPGARLAFCRRAVSRR